MAFKSFWYFYRKLYFFFLFLNEIRHCNSVSWKCRSPLSERRETRYPPAVPSLLRVSFLQSDRQCIKLLYKLICPNAWRSYRQWSISLSKVNQFEQYVVWPSYWWDILEKSWSIRTSLKNHWAKALIWNICELADIYKDMTLDLFILVFCKLITGRADKQSYSIICFLLIDLYMLVLVIWTFWWLKY